MQLDLKKTLNKNKIIMKSSVVRPKYLVLLLAIFGCLSCVSCKCDLPEEVEDEKTKRNTSAQQFENDSIKV